MTKYQWYLYHGSPEVMTTYSALAGRVQFGPLARRVTSLGIDFNLRGNHVCIDLKQFEICVNRLGKPSGEPGPVNVFLWRWVLSFIPSSQVERSMRYILTHSYRG
jgi:hypothetical protein